MANQPYYKQKFETLNYPEHMSSVVNVASEMFHAEAWANDGVYSDSPEASRLYWDRDGERLVVNLVSNALIIALESRHLEGCDVPFAEYDRASLTIAPGFLDRGTSVHFATLTNPRGIDDMMPEGWVPPMKMIEIPRSYDSEFRVRLNHSMARLGLEWQLAS